MPRNFSRLLTILGAALLAGAPALHAQSGQPVRGDVDGDGRVTAADARIVSDFLVGKPVPPGANVRERGDVNGDGRITSVDAAIIARAAAGRDVSRFPVGKPAPGVGYAMVACDGDVRARTLSCGAPGATGGARGNVTVGGQNINVKLISSNLVINPADSTFTFKVAILNLLRQAMAADSGTGAANSNGIRVFFHTAPYETEAAASGSGHTVTVDNPDSLITFTNTGPGGEGQPYFQYAGALLGPDGVLPPNDTSGTRTWTLKFDPGVNKFHFELFLDTPVQFPQGWIDIYPPPPPARQDSSPTFIPTKTLLVGETAVLTGTVRNRFGSPVGSPISDWDVTSHGAASLGSPTSDSTVVVTADSIGTDTVTATHGDGNGVRTGRIAIVVTANMVKHAGDGQTAAAGSAVSVAPAVKVTGFGGTPVAGVPVTFAVASGGGSVTGAVDTTDASGVASVGSWTLGPTAGTTNTLTATSPGLTPVTVTFSATSTAGALHHFVVQAPGDVAIPNQLAGTPFNVKVTAKDVNENTVTSFTGQVNFTTPTAPTGGGVTAGGTSAAFVAGVLSSHSIKIDTAGDYTLAATVTGGGGQTGTSNPFQVQAPPIAVNDGPTPTSAPGNPYHTALNTTFNLPTLGIMANDTRGFPLATVVSFGGDSLGGAVTDHPANGSAVSLPGHATGSLAVSANGSLVFTPPTGFTGLYTFRYAIGNVRDTTDAQVTIAVGVRPGAVDESYGPTLIGNVPINTTTSTNFTVLTNDQGDARTAALVSATNGTATVNSNGTFSFTPTLGYEGPASITYKVSNGFGDSPTNGTVSLTVSKVVWFVNASGGAGDGRVNTPFNCLAGAGCFDPVAADDPNDFVFLYTGAYTGGLTLLTGQRLIGQAATASLSSIVGVTWPADAVMSEPSTNGTAPTITTSAAATNGVNLGSGNTLRGFNLGNATGSALRGTSFGTLTVSEVGINTTGQALNLTTSGTLSGSFTGVTSTGGTNNVALSGVTFSGGVGLGGGVLTGASGSALLVTNGTSAGVSDVLSYSGRITNATAIAANAAVAVSGGSTRLTLSDSVTQTGSGAAVSVSGGSAILTLTGSVTQSGSGAAVSVSGGHTGTLTFNTGRVSASNGTGLQFDNANGSYDFGSSPNLSLAGGDAGIDVLNGSGGTFTFASSAFVNNPTGDAVRINASSPTFTYPGRITKTNGSTGITVSNNTSGTISFGSRAKTITSTGSNVAVNLATNGTATITFSDSLVVTSATGNAFNATGGGTVVVTGASSGANNSLSSSGGIALNVTSTTIGAGGLNFRRIDATGGSSGIVLNATGATAGLTVSGNGSAGTGGTIQSTTGPGISLTNTTSPSFTRMVVQNTGSHGISGALVNNFSFTNGTISVSGTTEVAGRLESNINFYQNAGTGTEKNVTGTVTITGNTLNNALHHGVNIIQYDGTISSLNISNNSFTSATASSGSTTGATTSHGSAISISTTGSAGTIANVTSATISNNVITGFPGNAGIFFVGGNATVGGLVGSYGSSGDSLTIQSNRIRGHSAANPMNTNAIAVGVNGRGTGFFRMLDNGTVAEPITNMIGHAVVVSALGTATVGIRVANNRIVANNQVGSQGISMGADSAAGFASTAVLNATVSSNVISATNGSGIFGLAANRGTVNAKLLNNTISAPTTGTYGIQLRGGSTSTNTGTMCVDISGNTTAGGVNGGTTFPGIGLRRQSGSPAGPNLLGIVGLSPSPTGTPTVENYVNSKNTSASGTFGVGGTALISATTGFTSCTLAF